MNDLYGNICPDCSQFPSPLGEGQGVRSDFSFDETVISAALKRIYSKDFNPLTEIEENLFNETWSLFNRAADKGFSMSDYTPGEDFIREIKYSNAVFSAFRVHRMQNDIAKQLLDENGKLKTFSRFAKDVEPITDHHVRQWLRTEYDTAIIRAHQAADWKRFELEKDVLPNLEWMPTTSLTPGEDHRPFWGTIKPVDDPFWSAHRPGDRWNCKCRLQASDKQPTPELPSPAGEGQGVRSQPGLENNPANDGMIFGEKHPFYVNTYVGAEKAVKQFIDKKGISDIVEAVKEYAGFTREKSYKNGGNLFVHQLVDKSKSDYQLVKNIAIEFASKGGKVKQLPTVHFKSDEYKQIFKTLDKKYYRKCPDLMVNGKFYEVEGFIKPWTKKKVGRMLSHGLEQSSNIIIDNTKGCSDRYIRRLIFDRVRLGAKVDEVWVYEKGKIRQVF